ncbi:hypothetical protein [Meiothermus hypogaeus]|uniref:Uncharacterized protein n=2 Tax=Meiothermus hypogaeus TaxID=884155 RepID=A0A511R2U2_9DEIN|nr:hypothetical protein [Meiothermus hypogaeus]RIH76838.1 hypothetical protein Mhypo_02263 [Meiothermus hypogaeus]GEM83182.1 hypothetical protein MHY01S_13480 [Meiothermus hypogaeus NBRC 106114]
MNTEKIGLRSPHPSGAGATGFPTDLIGSILWTRAYDILARLTGEVRR